MLSPASDQYLVVQNDYSCYYFHDGKIKILDANAPNNPTGKIRTILTIINWDPALKSLNLIERNRKCNSYDRQHNNHSLIDRDRFPDFPASKQTGQEIHGTKILPRKT